MHKLTAPPPLQGGDGTSRRLRIRKRSASLNTTKALSPKAQERKKKTRMQAPVNDHGKRERLGRFVPILYPNKPPKPHRKQRTTGFGGNKLAAASPPHSQRQKKKGTLQSVSRTSDARAKTREDGTAPRPSPEISRTLNATRVLRWNSTQPSRRRNKHTHQHTQTEEPKRQAGLSPSCSPPAP